MRMWFSAVLFSACSTCCLASDFKAGLRGRHDLVQQHAGMDIGASRLARGKTMTKAGGKGPDVVKEATEAWNKLSGHYFGYNFDSSSLAVNPWSYLFRRGVSVVSDLKPTAPFDRVDRRFTPSYTGAAPVPPGEDGQAMNSQMPFDWNPPYKYPHLFPEDAAPHKDLAKGNYGEVRLEDRHIIARPDVLRPPWWTMDHIGADPYPLVAPADRIRPGPYPHSIEDKVDQKYARYFTQMAEAERARLFNAAAVKALERVDKDKDNSLSWDEYTAELQGHQKKTEAEARYLWRKFHTGLTDVMTPDEYKQLALTGFDLGEDYVNRSVRTDVMAVLTFAKAPHVGFWGSGGACAPGAFVTGVQLKVKPTGNYDNTGVNALKFKCSDGKEVQTAEGPDGSWTDWAECLPGQKVYTVKARVQPFSLGQDNSGVNDLAFECRSGDLDKNTKLLFSNSDKLAKVDEGYVLVGDSYVKASEATSAESGIVRAKGEVGVEGGWSEDESCGTSGLLCGAMVRLQAEEGAKDNMGITDMRFMCCSKPLDCTPVCHLESRSPDCQACLAKAQTKSGAPLQPALSPAAAVLPGAAPAPAAAS